MRAIRSAGHFPYVPRYAARGSATTRMSARAAHDPEISANLTRLRSLWRRERYFEAAALAKSTLEQAQGKYGEKDARLVEPLVFRSRLQSAMGFRRAGNTNAFLAINLANERCATDHPEYAAAQLNQASLLLAQGKIDRARACIARTTQAYSKPGFYFEYIEIMTLLAKAHLMAGDNFAAQSLLTRGQGMLMTWFPREEHVYHEMFSVLPVGLLFCMGKPAQALAKARELEPEWAASTRPHAYARGAFLEALCSVHAALKDLPSALDCGERAYALWEQMLGSTCPDLGPLADAIAKVASAMGDEAKAEHYRQQVARITDFLAKN